MPFNQKFGALIAAVAFSAGAAGLFVGLTSAPAESRVAGVAFMEMLRDEHALVTDAVAENVRAQREADLAADREVMNMKIASLAPAPEIRAITVSDAKFDIKTSQGSALRKPPLEPAVTEPLQLAAALEPAKPAARPAGNLVTRQLRQVVTTVERVPGLVVEAANWMVELPAQALPRLTQRRYFSIAL